MIFILFAVTLIFLIFPLEFAVTTRDALNMCINSVIPSLFPFAVISRLIVLNLKGGNKNPPAICNTIIGKTMLKLLTAYKSIRIITAGIGFCGIIFKMLFTVMLSLFIRNSKIQPMHITTGRVRTKDNTMFFDLFFFLERKKRKRRKFF